MKFAKELEDELVPEWKVKYFNYKQGKKKIKALQRAVRSAQRSPATPLRGSKTFKSPNRQGEEDAAAQEPTAKTPTTTISGNNIVWRGNLGNRRASDTVITRENSVSRPVPIPTARKNVASTENDAERHDHGGNATVWTRYGSIIGSPPSPALSRPDTLNLPEPAMDPGSEDGLLSDDLEQAKRTTSRRKKHSPGQGAGSAFEVGKTKQPSRPGGGLAARHMSLLSPSRLHKLHSADTPLFKKLFSSKTHSTPKAAQFPDVPLEALKEIEVKQIEFWNFLDKEMEKIEAFYKSKEDEATQRLQDIKEQLHIMRDQRLEDLVAAQKARAERKASKQSHAEGHHRHKDSKLLSLPDQLRDMPNTMDVLYHPLKAAKRVHFGKNQSPNHLATPPSALPDSSRDYTRKPEAREIPYHTAKRKLKIAMQEFYRGLELLKSYALLNRTAFRKINKKYDKAVHARPTMRYMTEKVDSAWFVKSTTVDDYLTATEDLYARYFEKGSHKVAVGKLRRRTPGSGAYNSSVFRNGLSAAAGIILGIEGLVKGATLYYSGDEVTSTLTSYLLQVYAGYFLLLFLVLFFCLDCYIFSRAKVNYAFIFEFDTRHSLDWRQLSEMPCFFLFLMGLTIWLNFTRVGGDTMFLWWPVVLIGLTVVMTFMPFRILYVESRKWFLFTLWRLLLPGIYPVEFRDFFMGDMLCSETYSLGGIELFFCLYANSWINPDQCNSSSSRLMGFFMTLPGIMRLLQCLRRYYDTRNVFPHLVNGGKYTFTILQYVSLSLFRIDKTESLRAFFITCATINGIYTSMWDLVMDWSLMDPYAPHPFLRHHIAYKSPWPYYVAMVIDPILRFNWVFYAIPYFTDEIQHSAILGFAVSFSEVIRRGIWTIFRVENEHCTNVTRFRASRDKPLPYKLESDDYERASNKSPEDKGTPTKTRFNDDVAPPADPEAALAEASGAYLERTSTHETAISSLRRRQQQGIVAPSKAQSIRSRAGTILHAAHAQDYERKRKEDMEAQDGDSEDDDFDDDGDDDDDDEEDTQSYRARVASNAGATGQYEEEDEEDAEEDRERDRETARDDRIDREEASALFHHTRGY